jgi:KUP system potassium uptake protein
MINPGTSRIASPAKRTTHIAAAAAALGIVYGDLGTSPLYTYQAIVAAVGGHPSPADALGLLSLVVWALIVTISLKYCVFVMRADNHGEGGILALMALVTSRVPGGHATTLLVVMGLSGAALIYGDGIITPAISVLSALEGVNLVTDATKPYVLPASIAILACFVPPPTSGHRQYRPRLRTDHDALVRHHRRTWPGRGGKATRGRDRS